MKTLLLDNYDSYTYNLFQLMADVFGREPVVLPHDVPDLGDSLISGFDAAVISPGPGHPGRPRDFGRSADLVAQVGIPVLGVCLGHQGIGLSEQARVVRAPQARHGFVSTIRHSADGLFEGIPQEFRAVRYHSLAVAEPLPPTLVATAWSEDGVVMALRHRDRPLWGVQFHPESVLTEHGAQLMANFGRLARPRRPVPVPPAARDGGLPPAAPRSGRRTEEPACTEEPPPCTEELPRTQGQRLGAEQIPRPSAAPGTVTGTPGAGTLRVYSRAIGREVCAEEVFTRRFAGSPCAFWLDSSLVEPGRARFSYLGDGSGPLAEILRYDVEDGVVRVERPGAAPTVVEGTVFDRLRTGLARPVVGGRTLPFDFAGGYVGYLGYEVKADCGAVPVHRAATPDACWLFADRLVVIDHQERRTHLVCLAPDTAAGAAEAGAWLSRTQEALAGLGPAQARSPGLPGGGGGDLSPEPWLDRDRSRYLRDVEACRNHLLAGESYEICLTNAARLPALGDAYDYYRILRSLNPAPHAAFLRFGDVAVASASPERFLSVSRDGRVQAKPIKGTVRRDPSPAVDAALRDGLRDSAKTRAENLMIVDLLRNDLGRVCEIGSVTVDALMVTESYATVHQLVSTIEGRLRPEVDAVECVRACFPGGSMTGAPKLRTLELIDELETRARGVYSGVLGFLGCTGTADLSIVIRTAVIAGGQVHLGAGGAVVLDSDPVEEYDEMLLKLAASMRAYRVWRDRAAVRRRTPAAVARPRARAEVAPR